MVTKLEKKEVVVLLTAVMFATANTALVIGAIAAFTDPTDAGAWLETLTTTPLTPASCIFDNTTNLPHCLPWNCICVDIPNCNC